MSVVPKPAATLLLLRDYHGELQVFMQQRAYESPFVGGAYVFPGGKVDACDEQMDSSVLTMPESEAAKVLFQKPGAQEAAIAAIRECFEEAGILLAYEQDSLQRNAMLAMEGASRKVWQEKRALLNQDAITLAELCQQHHLSLALDQLVFVGHWITPTSSAHRFDTLFFACAAPAFQQGDHDDYETVKSVWWSAEEALAQYANKQIELITPTLATLKHLASFTDSDSFLQHHRQGLTVLGRG